MEQNRELRCKNFIEKANRKWNNKYDYSKVEYVNGRTDVCIVCPIHGEFHITPRQHLCGHGCTRCAKNGKITTKGFVKKATYIHNDKYDYSKVEYVNAHTKVCIICPKHGEFWQSATAHLRGQGCPKCHSEHSKPKGFRLSNIKQGEKEEVFIKKAKEIHGDKYDYSKVMLGKHKDDIYITCPIHGGFWQRPYVHLKGGECRKCATKKVNQTAKLTKEQFIERANEIHNGKYDYSQIDFSTLKDKVFIICHQLDENNVEHGGFWQEANSHLHGSNCPKCGKEGMLEKLRMGVEEFIDRAKLIHKDRYDYSNVKYENLETKVSIICPKHGEFLQRPSNHLKGGGCPKCNSSKLETEIIMFLKEQNIQYIYEYKPTFLQTGKSSMRLDFYLPQYNIAIECQGIQHFEPSNFGSRQIDKYESLEQTQNRDKKKYSLCKENGLRILYYTNIKEESLPQNYFDKIHTDKNELLEEITKHQTNDICE